MAVISSVNVTTQACQSDLDTIANADALGLPRFSGGEGDAQNLNIMAQQLEATINERALKDAKCQICPTNGAVILNCQDCNDFMIMATEDINSISMLNCDKGDGTIDVYIPPNTTRKICGWPETFGFEGGECFDGSISGGTNPAGRVYSFPYQGTNRGAQIKGPGGTGVRTAGGGGSGGGGACACTQSPAGTLTIVSCTAGSSMGCSGSNPHLDLKVCGGVPPYSWSTTGGTMSGTEGNGITLTSPANTGSGVAGIAYTSEVFAVGYGQCNQNASVGTDYGCNNQVINPCGYRLLICGPCTNSAKCSGSGDLCAPGGCNDGLKAMIDGNEACATCGSGGTTCDLRSAQMITDGCNPCGTAMPGKVVTVTDSLGTSVSKTIAV